MLKRRSRRDDIIAFNAADAFYAAAKGIEPKNQQVVPPLKERGRYTSREAPILKAILSMLRKHPAIATVERRQVGLFTIGNRVVSVGRGGDPDISGMLKGSARAYFIEVKAPGSYPDPRQKRRLAELEAAGAVVGVARSVQDAQEIIDAALA